MPRVNDRSPVKSSAGAVQAKPSAKPKVETKPAKVEAEEIGWKAKLGTAREAVEWVGGGAGKIFGALKGGADLPVIGPLGEIACVAGLATEVPAMMAEGGETMRTVRESVRKGELATAGDAVVEFGRESLRVVKCVVDSVELAAKVGSAATKLIKSTAMGAKLAGATARAVGRAAALPGLRAVGPAMKAVSSGPLGRAAARFAPGLNIAIAAIDTAYAVQTLRDPKAGLLKKIASVVTAAGSIAAATNIPIVSQIGAAASMIGFFTANIVK